MDNIVRCKHGRPVIHRISRKPQSYGRSFSCCPIHWEDKDCCKFFSWDDPPRDEPRAQVVVKQYQTTAEYMSAPPTASASSRPVKGPTTSSIEVVLQVPSGYREKAFTGPDSSREYGRPSPLPLKSPATAQSEFMPTHPIMSEGVIQDILDALPLSVRELKRQISTLQESNEMMESRILQLEKQLWENEKWRGFD